MSHKKTIQKFICEATLVHGLKYNYSQSIYKNNITKIEILCPVHGIFLQAPYHHLLGNGCPECSRSKQALTVRTFIERAIKTHGNSYDYSKVKYRNIDTKVVIVCPVHGSFKQTPDNHMRGKGCYFCGNEKISEGRTCNTKQFVTKARKIFGDRYDYSKVEYSKNSSKVKIVCKTHGVFKQVPASHLAGRACPRCANNIRSTVEGFISRARKIHGDKYVYSKIRKYKNNHTKVPIVCKSHGVFYQDPKKHTIGRGCPKCAQSDGERAIERFLLDNNVKFRTEKCFKNLTGKNGGFLRFDFYIKNINTCIEFDGPQHYNKKLAFKIFGISAKRYSTMRANDRIKNIYCKNMGIKLIRIPYSALRRIPDILVRALPPPPPAAVEIRRKKASPEVYSLRT